MRALYRGSKFEALRLPAKLPTIVIGFQPPQRRGK